MSRNSERPFKATLTNSYHDEIWTRAYSTKENALLKATALMLQDCAPGCVVTVHTKDGDWQGTAKLHVGGKITITKKED